MIASVDQFLDRKYVPGKYVCIHHASEVWKALTGSPLHEDIVHFLEQRTLGAEARSLLQPLPKPVSPCIVLFRSKVGSHIGIYLRGRILHLTERNGAQFVPEHVVKLGYSSVKYYVQQSASN